MNDMSQVIIPKSDQVNADDYLSGPVTYRIESVEIRPGTEQPVSIHLAGEPRVWRPCKSMSRVLVAAWGPDASVYTGRSLTLYRDPKVKWGGLEVGGIRVSHMSHIERDMMLQLTATKGKRAPHMVKPLAAAVAPIDDGKPSPAQKWANAYTGRVAEISDPETLAAFANEKAKKLHELESAAPALHTECVAALDKRRAELAPAGFTDDADRDPEDFNVGDDSEADEPACAHTVANILALIDRAIGEASLDQATDEYRKHMMALPKEACADIEERLRVKKAELSGEGE